MFSKLRRQLTVVCAAVTGTVLLCMAAFSLHFSLSRLQLQYQDAFRSNINTVRFYLQSQGVVDQGWLNQTEADNGLWIRIESRNAQLQYTGQNWKRDAATAEALRYAQSEYAVDPFFSSGTQELLIFDFTWEGDSYYGCVTSLASGSDQLAITMLKDKKGENLAAAQLVAVFAVCVTFSITFLTLFAWYFSGKAARPVEEGHRKQTEFLSAAAHELKSPLAVISLSAQTIKKSPALAPELAAQVEHEAQRLAGLVSDLLFLAQSDQQAWTSRLKAASAKTILLNCAERYEQAAQEKGISLLTQIETPLPSLICDQQLTEQALSVFLDNALRFTPQGGTIRLSCANQRGRVRFTVEDSGCGIPDGEKDKVFDRFYQADRSRSSKDHYGLGLSIAREIAVLHKGSVTAKDSSLGGAAFLLCI